MASNGTLQRVRPSEVITQRVTAANSAGEGRQLNTGGDCRDTAAAIPAAEVVRLLGLTQVRNLRTTRFLVSLAVAIPLRHALVAGHMLAIGAQHVLRHVAPAIAGASFVGIVFCVTYRTAHVHRFVAQIHAGGRRDFRFAFVSFFKGHDQSPLKVKLIRVMKLKAAGFQTSSSQDRALDRNLGKLHFVIVV
jgi:hypothetical protein